MVILVSLLPETKVGGLSGSEVAFQQSAVISPTVKNRVSVSHSWFAKLKAGIKKRFQLTDVSFKRNDWFRAPFIGFVFYVKQTNTSVKVANGKNCRRLIWLNDCSWRFAGQSTQLQKHIEGNVNVNILIVT